MAGLADRAALGTQHCLLLPRLSQDFFNRLDRFYTPWYTPGGDRQTRRTLSITLSHIQCLAQEALTTRDAALTREKHKNPSLEVGSGYPTSPEPAMVKLYHVHLSRGKTSAAIARPMVARVVAV